MALAKLAYSVLLTADEKIPVYPDEQKFIRRMVQCLRTLNW
ncbi:hypothetical protein Aazo_0030 ['Nostoc azollae' 0708]|uniref:Uncharacterized protein n=1 Tax=Nostoc azollae (strain 0708) TaxID=551115 RepID=D7DVH6_NOSA0|nr:hypothetical protein Aazo_0030 ['Nostoc azollae' 0708]